MSNWICNFTVLATFLHASTVLAGDPIVLGKYSVVEGTTASANQTIPTISIYIIEDPSNKLYWKYTPFDVVIPDDAVTFDCVQGSDSNCYNGKEIYQFNIVGVDKSKSSLFVVVGLEPGNICGQLIFNLNLANKSATMISSVYTGEIASLRPCGTNYIVGEVIYSGTSTGGLIVVRKSDFSVLYPTPSASSGAGYSKSNTYYSLVNVPSHSNLVTVAVVTSSSEDPDTISSKKILIDLDHLFSLQKSSVKTTLKRSSTVKSHK